MCTYRDSNPWPSSHNLLSLPLGHGTHWYLWELPDQLPNHYMIIGIVFVDWLKSLTVLMFNFIFKKYFQKQWLGLEGRISLGSSTGKPTFKIVYCTSIDWVWFIWVLIYWDVVVIILMFICISQVMEVSITPQ